MAPKMSEAEEAEQLERMRARHKELVARDAEQLEKSIAYYRRKRDGGKDG